MKTWTTTDENILREMREQGYTYAAIAERLDRTQSQVLAHVRDMKRRDSSYTPQYHHTWNADEERRVIEMFKSGITASAIAAEIGCSQAAVYHKLKGARKRGEVGTRYNKRHL